MAFFPTFFLGNIGQKNVFYDILERKNTFLASKTKRSKSRKIETFPKGLTHGFGRKMAIFPIFFLQAIQARKMCFTIFQNEKTPFQDIQTRSSNSRTIEIFPKQLTHGFQQKMVIFPTFFFGNIGKENVFYDFLERKNAFLGYKNKKFKKSNRRKTIVNSWCYKRSTCSKSKQMFEATGIEY